MIDIGETVKASLIIGVFAFAAGYLGSWLGMPEPVIVEPIPAVCACEEPARLEGVESALLTVSMELAHLKRCR